MVTPTSKTDIIKETEIWVKSLLDQDRTGHDWDHIQRVRKNAREIGMIEIGVHQHAFGQTSDLFLVDLIALFHEMTDKKLRLFKNEAQALNQIRQFLNKHHRPPLEIQEIVETIPTIAYSKSVLVGKKITSLAGRVVQDADFLETLGYVGITRALAYSASLGRPIYDPSIPWRQVTPENYRQCPTAIHHIQEKVLTIKNHMNTSTGRHMAEPLHQKVQEFFYEFLNEWNN